MSPIPKYILYPISAMYGGIIKARHWLYNKKILKSTEFNFPIICVGNLALGGTGKSPMTEYLVKLLKPNYKVATLSRGYKRKTKGFAIADAKTTAIEIGDEPMQFHKKFPDITVAVGEERLVAIPQLLHDMPETQVIILDDAFQHRPVIAGLNIILTAYNKLYTTDLMVPSGTLRDVVDSAGRADMIVVTKCPENITEADRKKVIDKLKPLSNQTVYFTSIAYDNPHHLFSGEEINLNDCKKVLLISGVAQPEPLVKFVKEHFVEMELMQYPDHHIFSIDDLDKIKKTFTKFGENTIVLTTEKDGVRLEKFATELKDFPIYQLPIQHHFLFNQASEFNQKVETFVAKFD